MGVPGIAEIQQDVKSVLFAEMITAEQSSSPISRLPTNSGYEVSDRARSTDCQTMLLLPRLNARAS